MRPADACSTPGVILGSAGPGAWRVELPNGHRMVARLRRRDAVFEKTFAAGAAVVVVVSPADMSKGLLIRETE